jgi:hypothetical protein
MFSPSALSTVDFKQYNFSNIEGPGAGNEDASAVLFESNSTSGKTGHSNYEQKHSIKKGMESCHPFLKDF